MGLGYLAIRLQPYVDQINAASDLPAERNRAMEKAWKEFARTDLKPVEHAWIFESKFASKAKAYLMANVAFNVVPSSDFKEALSRYRATL